MAFYRTVGFSCLSHADKIPGLVFALFQSMFAAITPLLMTGSFGERMRFRAVISFLIWWEIIVYYPLAHWFVLGLFENSLGDADLCVLVGISGCRIWGGGFLDQWGVLDFAGGIVIHTSAGVSAIVIALGKLKIRGPLQSEPMGSYCCSLVSSWTTTPL